MNTTEILLFFIFLEGLAGLILKIIQLRKERKI